MELLLFLNDMVCDPVFPSCSCNHVMVLKSMLLLCCLMEKKNLGFFFSQQIFIIFLGKLDFPMPLVNQFLTDNILSLFILTALILTACLLSYSLRYYRLLQKPL